MMRDTSRRLWQRPIDDRGAAGTVFALLLGFGVLMGVAAMVADVGQMVVERRQLQNAADASALAFAQRCAYGLTGCPNNVTPATNSSSTKTLLDPLAAANSQDGKSKVSTVCGALYVLGAPADPAPSGIPNGLPVCPSPSGLSATVDCKATSVSARPLQFVRVYTETLTSSGSSVLKWLFARALPGRTGSAGTTMHACAQAWWGGRSAAAVAIPLAISLCNFEQLGAQTDTSACHTANTLDGAPTTSTHNSSISIACDVGDSSCTAAVHWSRTDGCLPHALAVGNILQALNNGDLNGNNPPCTSATASCVPWTTSTDSQPVSYTGMPAALCLLLDKDVLVPVFEVASSNTNGSIKTVRVITFAVFHMTGFLVSSSNANSKNGLGTGAVSYALRFQGTSCPVVCVAGYFVKDTNVSDYSTNPGSVPNLGYQTLRLVP